ncbi:MAG: C10 family peptidase [Bacteroidales bacterium]|nr:C10 family peptidase [Bacteroidales bacterium]
MKVLPIIAVNCFVIISAITSCNVDSLPLRESSSFISPQVDVSPNRASLTDVYSMVFIATKGNVDNITIEPFIDDEGDTLMYIVNFENGWKILSADKRTPAVIAEGDFGSISLSTDNDNWLGWLKMAATDMKHVIHSDDSNLNFTELEIASHRQQWSKKPLSQNLRFPPDSLPILPYNGEWELQSTGTSEVYYDHIDHLVDAHWDQWYPYNYYCPKEPTWSNKAPAGCVPVACGQLLQFLCSNYDIDYSFSWNGETSYVDSLSLNYSGFWQGKATPLLLRFLGNQFDAEYTDTSTSVTNALDKVRSFYATIGISCNKLTYSAEKVRQNFSNGLPTFVTGVSGPAASVDPEEMSGHAYIIDGYKRTRTAYWEYYTRLIGYPPILEERTDTVSYSSPHINQIKMNWGWWSQWVAGNNDGWYALTGDWYVTINTPPETYSFTNNIGILCDYSYSSY